VSAGSISSSSSSGGGGSVLADWRQTSTDTNTSNDVTRLTGLSLPPANVDLTSQLTASQAATTTVQWRR